jgi:hypothetical protein
MELSGNPGLRNRLCGGNIPYVQADHPGGVADLEMVEEAECRWKKKRRGTPWCVVLLYATVQYFST